MIGGRWQTGYYNACPWAPGPIYDALADLLALGVGVIGTIQRIFTRAAGAAHALTELAQGLRFTDVTALHMAEEGRQVPHKRKPERNRERQKRIFAKTTPYPLLPKASHRYECEAASKTAQSPRPHHKVQIESGCKDRYLTELIKRLYETEAV
ncbi:MAG: hypothetical protein ACLQPD_14900 [Desulfomonilaceae bacterium]